MTFEEYLELGLKKGRIHKIHWKRTLNNNEVLKDFRGRVEKETIGNFRIGVDYSKMAINKDKIIGSLPYGYFEYSNEILYSEATNTYQLRLTQTMNKSMAPKVKWYLDGEEIEKDKLIELKALGARQRETKPFDPIETPVFNVKLQNIISIK